MSRVFLSGLVAIALLFLGSVAILYRFGGGAPRPSPASPSVGESAATARGSPGAATPSPPPTAASAIAADAPLAAPKRSREPFHRAPEVQDVMPAPRRRALVSFRQQLIAGLADLEKRVARCAGGGGSGRGDAAQPAARPAAGLAASSFVLAVETVADGVLITEVQVEARGSASEAEMACARAALRGQVIPARSAEPGRQWQLRFSPRT